MADGPRFLQRLTHRDYPWLQPPPGAYGVTVVNLLGADPGRAFEAVERQFAEATWGAWSAHHERVRRWFADPGALPPPRLGR
jgi:hypothetical protein